MSRKPSTILEYPIDKPQVKKMPRKLNAAELKRRLKELKVNTRIAKKALTDMQKEFIAAPTVETGKMYREATSQFIKAVMAQDAIENKMAD
jgi:hypothetical protein